MPKTLAHEICAHEMHDHETYACKIHARQVHMKGFARSSASEHRRSRTSVLALARVSALSYMVSMLSHMGFSHRRSVCLGISAHRPCFDPVCPSLFCRSDWLANPIPCASLPRLTLPLCR
jgi:hypothetical protein